MSAWAVSFRLKKHADPCARALGLSIERNAQMACEMDGNARAYGSRTAAETAGFYRRELETELQYAQQFLA